ncbi:BatD family protein [Carboxylicivirga sp. RSCT41]|uniref:BatD family protein n=1 Tax=Carboxylicivirga agarovorans TaxID=3417570 RepID=UPI003D34A5CF
MVKFLCISTLIILITDIKAQNIDAFATARVNTRKVVIEQPVKVSVKAYSSTWFTQPLSFGNLQVEGAYIQAFKRTQSSIEYINGKKYAALEFYYVVFPYTSGEITFPELALSTSIPPEGDYKGQPVTLRTKAISITVEPAPEDAEPGRWLVASDARVSNEWSLKLNKLKVGDVVSRKITTRASGTLPTFIDEPLVEQVDFASIYTSEPEFIDDRDHKSVNGRRIDTYSYLLEEAGEFTIPELEISWWNPYMQRFYKRKLPAYTLTVQPNDDLAELELLKDSLQALKPSFNDDTAETAEADSKPYKKYIIAALIGLVLLYMIIKTAIYLRKRIIKQRLQYVSSERYWFNRLLRQKNRHRFIAAIYSWIDHLNLLPGKQTFKAISSKDEKLKEALQELNQSVYSSKAKNKQTNIARIKSRLRQNRKRYTSSNSDIKAVSLNDLNPK